jgi:hypothetical protein
MLHALVLLLSFCLLIVNYHQALQPFITSFLVYKEVTHFLVGCFQPHKKSVYPNATHF